MKLALSAVVLFLASATQLQAQRIVAGGGIAAASVPRALHPLCAAPRRLDGVGVSAHGGTAVGSFRVVANVDYVGRFGFDDQAGCVPRQGISVDSSFSRAGNSATTLSVSGWTAVARFLNVGAEAGAVLKHSSWFVGPALGIEFARIRLEGIARRYVTDFDEITRDYQSGETRELSRKPRSETSWGVTARLVLLAL